MLRGSPTALVTPFDKDGRFDEKAFRAFVDWQIAEGTQRPRPGRHDGRIARRSRTTSTRVVVEALHRGRGEGRVPGDRRRRLQQHRAKPSGW